MPNPTLLVISILFSVMAIWFAGGFAISVAEGLVMMIIGFGVFWVAFTLVGLLIPSTGAAAILGVVLAIVAVRQSRESVVESVPGGAS